MSSCMDSIANQYLMDQYKKSATGEAGGNVLSAMVLSLEADGLSIPDAYNEVCCLVKGDEKAEVALAVVRKTHNLAFGS